MVKLLKFFFCFCTAMFFYSCDKKYECACDGYEGLKSVKRYKYRSENLASADATCQAYEVGTQGNLVCTLE